MACTTSIYLESETKNLLDGLKIHKQESYNSVVKRLVSNAYDNKLSVNIRKRINKAISNLAKDPYGKNP
jgi:hypothetical protein